MTLRRFSRFCLWITIIILLLSLIPVNTQAQIGAGGGTVTLKSDIEMMSGIPVHGGGHFTWIVTGAAAGELRTLIIEKYDVPAGPQPRNGMLEETEIGEYKLELERYLDDENNEHEYMGASIRNTASLNSKVKDYTEGLLGASNATTGKIVIKFYFEAWMEDAGDDEFELSDTTIANAIFHPFNETYVGKYEIEHTEYMVNIASYADVKITKGSFFLIRTPFGEIYHYSVKFDAQDNPRERLTYQPFNWLEAPLVLFIVMVVFGYFVVTMPGRFRRYDVMKVIKLHTFAKVLLLILILLYFFAAFGGVFIGGIYLILICVVFLFVSLVVSKTIYENAKRITTMPEKPDTETPSDALEDELEEEMGRDVQCTTCGEIFSVGEDRFRLDSTPCPACGSIGAVEFSRTEERPPTPPPEDLESIEDSRAEKPPPPPPPEDLESTQED